MLRAIWESITTRLPTEEEWMGEKTKNEEREARRRARAEWWDENGVYVTITAGGIIAIAALVIFLAAIIHENNLHLWSEPQYSHNANVLLRACVGQESDLVSGYIIQCMEESGFTLSYQGEPVRRVDQ